MSPVPGLGHEYDFFPPGAFSAAFPSFLTPAGLAPSALLPPAFEGSPEIRTRVKHVCAESVTVVLQAAGSGR